MGKFSNKELPFFLKKANYYSDDETFDNEAGRNPQVTEECETCGQEQSIPENKVLRFADFLNEKKYQRRYDRDGDGDNDFEDYKKFKTDAINKSKKKASGVTEGHSCHDGSKNMLSEAAHHLIESMCESTYSDASMYENDEDPEHKYEGYINEACAYMEKCMYEMVDDGLTVNEGWNNESACYESTCGMIKEVCEKLCHEGLDIHTDDSDCTYNDYVKEAVGCYRNGLAEYGMGGYGMNESTEEPKKPTEDNTLEMVTAWLANSENQEKSLTMSPEDQAKEIGISLADYTKALETIKSNM